MLLVGENYVPKYSSDFVKLKEAQLNSCVAKCTTPSFPAAFGTDHPLAKVNLVNTAPGGKIGFLASLREIRYHVSTPKS